MSLSRTLVALRKPKELAMNDSMIEEVTTTALVEKTQRLERFVAELTRRASADSGGYP